MADTFAADPPKAGPALGGSISEVQGVFPSDASLQDAIAKLTQAGFDRADLSLPAADPPLAQATPEQGAENPNTETDDRQLRTLESSMAGSVGALAAAGLVIGTGGAALPAVIAAAAVGIGAGAATHMARSAASDVQHDARETEARLGRLVLSARITHDGKREQAESLMRSAGASRVEAITRSGGELRPA